VNVKEAVSLAEQYVQDIYAQEQLEAGGLEEVEFNEPSHEWRVTIGFSRPWQKQLNFFTKSINEMRSYKVISISDETQQVISLKNRNIN
jgi:hypothetical protein